MAHERICMGYCCPCVIRLSHCPPTQFQLFVCPESSSKSKAMDALASHLALKIPKVSIVTIRYQRYFLNGNSVKSFQLPNSSNSSSAKLLRRPISAATGAALPHRDHRLEEEEVEVRLEMAASDPELKDGRIVSIASAIRVIPDFPKPGILFQDITTLLLDPKAFKDTIDLFVERYRGRGISVVAGIEARGFIFGPPIALAIGAKFVPLRKPKKLPGEVISEEYSLEYGTDKIEMHVGAVQAGESAVVIDDLIATGGTLCAAIRLLERVGVHVVECACVIELPELKGRERLGDKPLFVLVTST